MNIVETNKKTMIAFGDLMSGTVFRDAGEIFLVTEDIANRNAVNMRTGDMICFDDDAEVEMLRDAKLII